MKYVGPVVIYKIIDPHNYLLMTLDGVMLRGIFEHERLKPTIIRTNQGNVQNLAELKYIMNMELKLDQYSSYFNKMGKILQDLTSIFQLHRYIDDKLYQCSMFFMPTT